MNDLPKRLKWFRENLKDQNSKWTQKYVADKIGVARVTYTAYENGTKTPPADIISSLADLFEVSTDYLLGRSTETELEEDEDFQNFIKEVTILHKEEPSDKEELEMLIDMYKMIKKRKNK